MAKLTGKFTKLPDRCIIPNGWQQLPAGETILPDDLAWDFVGEVFDKTTRVGQQAPDYLIYIRKD